MIHQQVIILGLIDLCGQSLGLISTPLEIDPIYCRPEYLAVKFYKDVEIIGRVVFVFFYFLFSRSRTITSVTKMARSFASMDGWMKATFAGHPSVIRAATMDSASHQTVVPAMLDGKIIFGQL